MARATLGEVLLARGEAEHACEELSQALTTVERAVGRDSLTWADVNATLGRAEIRAGRREAGISHLEEAVRVRERRHWDPRELARVRRDLAAAVARTPVK
jgi:hypothetical protein